MKGRRVAPSAAIEPPVVDLDDDQLAATSIAPETRQIVLAPPGSGKTEVVAALLESLNEQDVDPRDEVLAISFSRAAVAALRRRAGRGESSAPAIRTLDSLASRLLDEMDDQEWRQLSFDKRIARATRLLESGAEQTDLSMIRHLIIDEVQDLVGARAVLVLAIIARLDADAGFTLLGDPDQAIYDFQLEHDRDMTSGQFLDAVRRDESVGELRLRHQYRARTSETAAAATMLSASPTGEARTAVVRAFLAQITSGGDVTDVGAAARRWTGSTAFLCRTNGQALMVTKALREAGCRVETRAPSEELPIAPWIARALASVTTPTVRRPDVEAALDRVSPMGADEAWRLLKQAEGDFRVHDRLDLRRLREALLRRNLPAELVDGSPGEAMLVSTIHRAKGLEFDNVVIVNASDLVTGTATDEETSVAYVAATRPRDRLITARIDLPRGLRVDVKTGRWCLGGREKWMTFGFEVRGGDTEISTHHVGDLPVDELPLGREVSAELDRARSSLEVPVYRFVYNGRTVASTTEQFGVTLSRRLGNAWKRTKPWPDISGLAMESVETRPTPEVEVGSSGLELAVRIGGMAAFDWGTEGTS